MKKFMKMCGIDFVFCLLLFLFAFYYWYSEGLGVSFHVESANFGLICGAALMLFGNGFSDLYDYLNYRKSSAPADVI